MLRKNVSISDAHLKLLEPLLKKHQGNLSAAMRDIIDFTGFVTEHMGSLETAKDLLKEKNQISEQIRNRIFGVTIPLTMFKWMLSNSRCSLPPSSEAIQIFAQHNDVNIYDISSLSKMINEGLSILNWPVMVSINSSNGQISIQITGMDPEINNFNAALIAMYMANNKNPQKINRLMIYPSSVCIQLSSASSHEEAMQSIYTHFCDNKEDKLHSQNDIILVRT
ncbi:hypothetical protein ANME2D_03171 [Candidatus Methanoperedens nitroreducens]|uniref:Uncharacterized protein n=1 Tax=Candidatus Methanoperedens nitratireducens TaxID=1392998 RepID=A0A062V5Q3_9EURY|nr:hypothetical protein [Candidatus Methanoperedens nitroreducens]KCZ71139.1 hypothetical protein ANME2D_03171 [Candidatus Methanoperedens nitroreducens]MDJ1421483.1 hypothetical protein [Candidatus Methanoperedens sp.]